jgi:hypothetical protein
MNANNQQRQPAEQHPAETPAPDFHQIVANWWAVSDLQKQEVLTFLQVQRVQ